MSDFQVCVLISNMAIFSTLVTIGFVIYLLLLVLIDIRDDQRKRDQKP